MEVKQADYRDFVSMLKKEPGITWSRNSVSTEYEQEVARTLCTTVYFAAHKVSTDTPCVFCSEKVHVFLATLPDIDFGYDHKDDEGFRFWGSLGNMKCHIDYNAEEDYILVCDYEKLTKGEGFYIKVSL